MKRLTSIAALVLALAATACGSSSKSATPTGRLTLALQPTLDGGGDVKVTTITKVELLAPGGALAKAGTVSAGHAIVDLGGLAAGDYFVRLNDLADDLVPTRIADPGVDLDQFVGQKLRASLIGSLTDPTFRVKTFSKGQAEHAMVKYSDGTVTPVERYNYAIYSFKTTPQKLEIRVSGSNDLVLSENAAPVAVHPVEWALGPTNHGKPANYIKDAACSNCHGSLDAKPIAFSAVAPNKGFCFKCHYGKGGDPNGFVDGSFVLPAAGTLAVSLDATLDGGGDVKVTAITSASLVDGTGAALATGTIGSPATSVTFPLTDAGPGNYFVKLNGLSDDLMPTKVDDQAAAVTQTVGTKLRASLIGPASDPTYRVKTFAKGQGEHAMVKYSDGTIAAPARYNYAINFLKAVPSKMELREFDEARLILTSAQGGGHPIDWAVGPTNHGKPANYASDASCNGCHGSLEAHPADPAGVAPASGWCFKCHYGKGGDPNGFVDTAFKITAPGTLSLGLDASLDGGGTVLATTITAAELVDSSGKKIVDGVVGTPTTTVAFSLASVGPGFYFVKLNGLVNDLVPTYVADQATSPAQTVGTKLRYTVIGGAADPVFKLKTYSLGQGEAVIKKWSDGTDVSPPLYGYAVQSLKTTPQFVETRVLGTAALLVHRDAGAFAHTPGQGTSGFADWLLGPNNHGKPLNYVADASCIGCHGASLDTKPATYGVVSATSGWCFKCHYGKGGDASGLIDPAQ